MRCIVTAGPTYEKLDDVRRLTNFSTGRLGTELAGHLKSCGHEVILLVGEQATWRGERVAHEVQVFSTTNDLRQRLQSLGGDSIDAVFHAAAVSDFAFGRVFEHNAKGELHPVSAGKISSRSGTLMAELISTPKIIAELRSSFPKARIVGWKYEVDGSQQDAVSQAVKQIHENTTNACVVNGPAYGPGFGVVNACGRVEHAIDRAALFSTLIPPAKGSVL